MTYKELGMIIKSKRVTAFRSQKALAEAVGVKKMKIYRLERGVNDSVDVFFLAQVCKAIGLDFGQLATMMVE